MNFNNLRSIFVACELPHFDYFIQYPNNNSSPNYKYAVILTAFPKISISYKTNYFKLCHWFDFINILSLHISAFEYSYMIV